MAKQPDWEAIEAAFRAGSLSIRNIAEQYGIAEGTIRKRAKKLGWQRDLSDKVRKAAQDKLVREEVRTKGTQDAVRTDAEIVEQASSEAAAVVLSHRSNLADWRSISQKLCLALAGMDVTEDNHDKFARSLNAGVDAQLKVIKGERQAYNLDEPGEEDDQPTPTRVVFKVEDASDPDRNRGGA